MPPKLLSTAVAAAGIAVLAAGCGSSSSSSSTIDASAAKAAVERAAHVRLSDAPVPGDARDQGLEKAFSNAGTAAADKQIVFLFALKDGDTVQKLKDELTGSVPGAAKLMTHENLVVVYGSTGADHASDIKTTIDGL